MAQGKDKAIEVFAELLRDIVFAIHGLPHRLSKVMREDNGRFSKECPNCSKVLSKLQRGRHCPYCGSETFSDEELDLNLIKACSTCRHLYDSAYSYCSECGEELVSLHRDLCERILEELEEGIEEHASLGEGIDFYIF